MTDPAELHAHLERASMLRALAEAEECFAWWRRKERSAVGFTVHGLNLEEAERLVLTVAADLHEQRTGARCGALVLEQGDGGRILAGHEPGERLRDALEGVYRERAVR